MDALGAEGITTAPFTADVRDRSSLTRALHDATDHFGGIDVLEYSPGGMASTRALARRSPAARAIPRRRLPVLRWHRARW
jgi:NADP-dependent 3-hydroxy acid dehydrogenase YdfG